MKRCKINIFGSGPRQDVLRSEKGLALAMVLVLSLISLAIVATLIYLVTQGTKFSGFNKRYETAREAAYGGSEVIRALFKKQGDLSSLQNALSLQSTSTVPVNKFSACDCGDTTDPDNVIGICTYNNQPCCFCQKLCSPTLKTDGSYNWGTCDSAIDPTSGSYDTQFRLAGFGRNYNVFTKIVDTSVGTTDMSGLNLGGTAVTASSGQITLPQPYLYTIEITAQDEDYATNPGLKERGRLSVLYAH